jgi:protein O-mannosyl-transferase
MEAALKRQPLSFYSNSFYFCVMDKWNAIFSKVLRNDWISWLLIVIVTVFVYSNTFKFDILNNFDDDDYFNDISIKEFTAAHIQGYFSTYYLGMYQPVPILSYATLLDVFPGSIEAQRLANIVIHCLNALLVLLLVSRVTRIKIVAWLTALFFAIHPMHVESVTWISTRGNLLYSFFFLLTLLFYLDWRLHHQKWKLILVVLSFILALFCKVTAATLPLVILLLDLFRNRDLIRKSIALYAFLLLLSGIFIWIGVNASGSFGHITELQENYSLIERAFLILQALGLYLTKAVVPFSQSAIYLYPWKVGGALPAYYYTTGIICVIFLIAALLLGWKFRSKINGQAVFMGLLFFLITISIVLPLKWSRTILIAERYTYIPYIGLFGGLIMICYTYYSSISAQWLRRSVLLFLSLFIVYYSYASYKRNEIWESPVSLFTDVIRKNRSNAEVSAGYYNRGNEYLRLGKLNDAVGDYSFAIDLYPRYAEAFYNRGLTYYFMGNNAAAIDNLTTSIQIDGSNPDVFLNRAIAYRSIGKYDLALADFNYVISGHPGGLAYYNRGVLYYFNLGNSVQACSDWNKAVEYGYYPADELLSKFCK